VKGGGESFRVRRQLGAELVLRAGGHIVGEVVGISESEGVLLIDPTVQEQPGNGEDTFGVVGVEALIEARSLGCAGIQVAGGEGGVDFVVAVGRLGGDDDGPAGREAAGDLGEGSLGVSGVVEAERRDGQVDVGEQPM
jgi:hypothetical protein